MGNYCIWEKWILAGDGCNPIHGAVPLKIDDVISHDDFSEIKIVLHFLPSEAPVESLLLWNSPGEIEQNSIQYASLVKLSVMCGL